MAESRRSPGLATGATPNVGPLTCDLLCASLINFGITLQHLSTQTTLLSHPSRPGSDRSTSQRPETKTNN